MGLTITSLLQPQGHVSIESCSFEGGGSSSGAEFHDVDRLRVVDSVFRSADANDPAVEIGSLVKDASFVNCTLNSNVEAAGVTESLSLTGCTVGDSTLTFASAIDANAAPRLTIHNCLLTGFTNTAVDHEVTSANTKRIEMVNSRFVANVDAVAHVLGFSVSGALTETGKLVYAGNEELNQNAGGSASIALAATGAVQAMFVPQADSEINVKTFGATGNGTTDDSAAINRAVAAANSAGGGVVVFPRGTYLIDTKLNFDNLSHVHFDARSATFTTSATDGRHNLLETIEFDSCQHCTWTGGRNAGNEEQGTSVTHGGTSTKYHAWYVANATFETWEQTVFFLIDGCMDFVMRDVQFQGVHKGIAIQSSLACVLERISVVPISLFGA